jgi:hypothetical protein
MQTKQCEAGLPDGRRCPRLAVVAHGELVVCGKHTNGPVHFKIAAQRRYGSPTRRPARIKRTPGGYDLPFGVWKTKAGEAILFNRFRHPIFTRRPDGTVIPERPNRQVDDITDTLPFWPKKKNRRWQIVANNHGFAERIARCERVLQCWRDAARSGGPVSLNQLLGEQ